MIKNNLFYFRKPVIPHFFFLREIVLTWVRPFDFLRTYRVTILCYHDAKIQSVEFNYYSDNFMKNHLTQDLQVFCVSL